MNIKDITVRYAEPKDAKYAELIVKLIYESALQRGTGIAKRTPEYIAQKITRRENRMQDTSKHRLCDTTKAA